MGKLGPYPSERVISEPIERDARRAAYPAPWQVYLNTGHNRARIVDADGFTIISGMNEVKARAIASAVNRDNASPELLAALKALVFYFHDDGQHCGKPELEVFRNARAAIAKAESR